MEEKRLKLLQEREDLLKTYIGTYPKPLNYLKRLNEISTELQNFIKS